MVRSPQITCGSCASLVPKDMCRSAICSACTLRYHFSKTCSGLAEITWGIMSVAARSRWVWKICQDGRGARTRFPSGSRSGDASSYGGQKRARPATLEIDGFEALLVRHVDPIKNDLASINGRLAEALTHVDELEKRCGTLEDRGRDLKRENVELWRGVKPIAAEIILSSLVFLRQQGLER